jgi:hypothetical protein
VTGVVGCFNVQGSAWDRNRRKFVTHNPKPPVLSAQVSESCLAILGAGAAAYRNGASSRIHSKAKTVKRGGLAVLEQTTGLPLSRHIAHITQQHSTTQ